MASLVYALFILGTFASYFGMFYLSGNKARVAYIPFLTVLILVSVPFVLWDIWATYSGHWAFNQNYILGFQPFGIPIEELLFFVAIPLVCLGLCNLVQSKTGNEQVSKHSFLPILLLAIALAACAVLNSDRPYTLLVSSLGVLACVGLVIEGRLIRNKAFWISLAIVYVLFFISNTLLTALPVVTYGDSAIIGFRVGTIPIEDFVYNFILVSLSWLIYRRWSQKVPTK